MKKYDLCEIMTKAWELFRKYRITFSEALHRAWNVVKSEAENVRRIAEAKALAGISEVCNTWYGWRQQGYEVRHGEKSVFGVNLIYASKGDGEIYKARFFSKSQVQALA